jgi:hypothetical protein
MSVRARFAGGAALTAALLVVGCQGGNPNAPARVTGRVTYGGNPVTGGSVTFYYKDGVQLTFVIDPDGTYEAIDVPAGDVTVTVETESVNPDNPANKKGDYGMTGGGMGAKYGRKGPVAKAPKGKGAQSSPIPEGATSEVAYIKIPKKYSDPKASGLSASIKDGKQTHNFELTD